MWEPLLDLFWTRVNLRRSLAKLKGMTRNYLTANWFKVSDESTEKNSPTIATKFKPPTSQSACVRSMAGPSPVSTRSKGPSVNRQRVFLLSQIRYPVARFIPRNPLLPSFNRQSNQLLISKFSVQVRGGSPPKNLSRCIHIDKFNR